MFTPHVRQLSIVSSQSFCCSEGSHILVVIERGKKLLNLCVLFSVYSVRSVVKFAFGFLFKHPELFWVEADGFDRAGLFDNRAFDQRGLGGHQFNGLAFRQAVLVAVRQLPKGRAAFVEQCFPADGFAPLLDLLFIDAVDAEIVEAVIDAVLLQPVAGFFDGVAVLDAVERQHVSILNPAAAIR